MSETVETVAPEAAAPEASPTDDLRAAISAAFDEVEARDAESEASAEPEATEETEAPERDAQGRFVGKEGEAAEEAPAETAVAEPAAPALPAEFAPIKAVLDEHKSLYEARGLPPADAVRALFGAQKALQERPYEAIQALARDFGVDLTKFAGQQAPAAGQAQTGDPNYTALLQRLHTLEGVITERDKQAEVAEVARINNSIRQFAADPKHVHFPAVRQMMGALMSNGQANDLPTAYEMACRAHPEVFKAIQKGEQEARAKADTSARTQAAAQAKAKAVSVRGSPAVNGFTKPPESLRETIEAAWSGRLN